MKPERRLVASLLMSLAIFASTAGVAQEALVPPHRAIGGVTQREWSVRWWQWAASFEEYASSPLADQDGSKCALKQEGGVWFLAGTYGSGRTIRTCRIPAGKYIFLPLINYVVFPRDVRSASCAEYIAEAELITGSPSTLVLELDGRKFDNLEQHRQATPNCFDLGARSIPSARIYPTAANGYYVMLRPLNPGTHTLHFGGILRSMAQAITYTLRVE